MVDTKPNVLILGSETEPSKHILEQITKKQIESDNLQNIETLHLDTKFYTADINLIQTDCSSISNEIKNVKNVKVLILYIDCDQHKGLNNLPVWKKIKNVYGNRYRPTIKLLVTDHASETKITRKKAIDWCLRNRFEFIDLNFEESWEDDDTINSVFVQKSGIDRIIEILESNFWKNAVIKENVEKDSSDFVIFGQFSIKKRELAVRSPHQREWFINKLMQTYWELFDDSDNCSVDSNFL